MVIFSYVFSSFDIFRACKEKLIKGRSVFQKNHFCLSLLIKTIQITLLCFKSYFEQLLNNSIFSKMT